MPTRIVWAHRVADQTIRRTIDREMQSRRGFSGGAIDILSLFINAAYPDGSRMDNAAVRDEVMTLMSTGYETIGDALGWTWYLLAKHPEVEARMLHEIKGVLQGRLPSVDDVNKLRYTAMVLDESMRLYPPTWIVVRMAVNRDTLPSGTTIPAGAKIYVCQYVTHRHPSYYPNPERFDPERFSETAVGQRPRFAYFPFGGGPRTCIGEPFARLEGVMVLASLAPRFQFELLSGADVTPVPGITLRPKTGIHVRIKPR